MKAVVLYASKTGYTKKYADWIAEELSMEAYDLKKTENLEQLLTGKEILIYGGGLYAVGINGLKEILSHDASQNVKTLIVFCTGLSHDSEEVQKEVFDNNLKEAGKRKASLYYYRGGFDFKRLGFTDRMLMRLLKLKISMKKRRGSTLASDEKGMLAVFHRKVDFTDKSAITELIGEVRENLTDSSPEK